jgi:SPX domain protein involved in polyphosphate accumulation
VRAQELAKFNEFFMEKEEELVMMDKALGDRAAALAADPAAPVAALTAACHGLAKFHGELVLLEHWCSLNYAALVKILKKHDKRSSLSLRLPILVNVLRQPFYSTEVLSQLVRTTEERFHALAARLKRRAEEQAQAAAAAAAGQRTQQQRQPGGGAGEGAAGGAPGDAA